MLSLFEIRCKGTKKHGYTLTLFCLFLSHGNRSVPNADLDLSDATVPQHLMHSMVVKILCCHSLSFYRFVDTLTREMLRFKEINRNNIDPILTLIGIRAYAYDNHLECRCFHPTCVDVSG